MTIARIILLAALGLMPHSEGRSFASDDLVVRDLLIAQSSDKERQVEDPTRIVAAPPLAFLPLRDERIAALSGRSARTEASLPSPIYADGVHAILSIACVENATVPKLRIEKLFLDVIRIDLPTKASPSDISNIKALGNTAVDRLQITLTGTSVSNAFWRDMSGQEAFVRAGSFNRDLLDTRNPKVIDLSCKDNEAWTAKVDLAQRSEGLYRLRFVAAYFIGTRTHTVSSDEIFIERAVKGAQ